MTQSLIFKSLITWALFIPVAITNGFIREVGYKPFIGELAAHQISTVIAVTVFFFMVYLLRRHDFYNLSRSKLFLIGLGWVFLTILFEFGFGHYVEKMPWSRLLADYNIFNGRVWSLMLLAELLTPLVVKSLLKRNITP